jgi:hypothetical protein
MKTSLKNKEKNKENENRDRVTLFAAIGKEQYEAIRFIAYKEKKSLAEITRESLDDYIGKKSKLYPISIAV